MRELERRIEALEDVGASGACLSCEMAALNGSTTPCRHSITTMARELAELNDRTEEDDHARA